MRHCGWGLILAASAAILAAPVSAQYGYVYVPDFEGINAGQDAEMACRRGRPVHPTEVSYSTTRASALMSAYWNKAQAGQAPIETFLLDKHTRWTAGAMALDAKTLPTMKDPFAGQGNGLELKPLRFVRAGDGASALGLWQVTGADGKAVGTYRAKLRLKKRDWWISSLELVEPNAWAEPVVQYCHVPGDVLGYRLANAKAAVADAQRRLGAARQEEASARASEGRARAAAEAAPDNAGKQAAAKSAAEVLRRASDNANGFQSQFDQQSAELAKIEAEQKALEDQRAAGKAALAAGAP